MKREIKFRAWNKDQMVYSTNEFRSEHFLTTSGDILNRYSTVMQFTGLTDKNGKDIYEGDIVQSEQLVTLMPVDFEIGSFGVPDYHLHQLSDIEVIGNIYQNPELLK